MQQCRNPMQTGTCWICLLMIVWVNGLWTPLGLAAGAQTTWQMRDSTLHLGVVTLKHVLAFCCVPREAGALVVLWCAEASVLSLPGW